MKILLILIILPILVLSIIFGAWLIAIPEGMIYDFISNSIRSEKLSIKAEGIEKSFFFTLNIKKIEIKRKDETTLLIIENIQIRPNLLSLLRFNPKLPFTGQINSGIIEGSYNLKGKTLYMQGKDIRIEEIPSLRFINIEGQGNLSLKLEITDGQGDVIFNVKDARLKSTILPGGYILPLNWFNDIKGLFAVGKEMVEVKSFTLEGDGVYARIKGNIKGDIIDLKMELMPEESFKNQSLLMIIEPMKVSPGYYVIPINLKGLLV